ncbi:MAG TPA: hypothetical protein VN046_02695 [Stenotrophobium sp.]|jgi:hypothetical protein|nr:hypothetical protein [Stenotrophobium sp.]
MDRKRWLKAWHTFIEPAHLRRTGLIALAVGSWLTAFNLGDLLLQGQWSAAIALKLALNYLTPFVVSNLGLQSRRESR